LVCDGICVPAGEDGYRPALLDLVGGAVVVTPIDVDVAVTDSGSPVARGVSAGGTLDIAYASLSEVVVVHDALVTRVVDSFDLSTVGTIGGLGLGDIDDDGDLDVVAA